jgi:hypothetical protein
MQSLLAVWEFVLLISIFAFPQLLGILLYYRLTLGARVVTSNYCGFSSGSFVFLGLLK